MSIPSQQHFDFSLDAMVFKEQLARQLNIIRQADITPLADDDLDYINAAGSSHPAPDEKKLP